MKLKLHAISAILLLTVVACNKYDTLPAPPVVSGDCQYNKAGLSQTTANSELSRIVGIFQNSSIGTYAIQVKSSQVYVSSTKNGQPTAYGIQVIFSCDGAEIKFEDSRGYYSDTEAVAAFNDRMNVLNAGRYVKVLEAGTGSTSTESCDTCSTEVCDTCTDDDGNNYDCNCHTETYDCNCKTSYEYYYQITYAQVNPNNQRQAAFLGEYQAFTAQIAAANGGVQPNVSDTLNAAKKILPAFTTEGKVVRDWKSVIDKMRRMKTPKTACPAKAKRVNGQINSSTMPNSKHRLYL